MVGAVSTQTKSDLSIDLAKLSPYLQVPARILKVTFGTVDKVPEDFALLDEAARKAFTTSERTWSFPRVRIDFTSVIQLTIDPVAVQAQRFRGVITASGSVLDVPGAATAASHHV
jgi:hypothetical protein